MRVEWSRAAEEHLESIRAFASRTSPAYGEALISKIVDRTWQLRLFPESGAFYGPARVLQVRFVLEGSYRILYVVGRDHIDIIGVVHTSRRGL